ncbi:MAG TPA: hypothetical protein VHN11_14965 [Xanthobacteraceae bacterium]|jgi:hypothetical protein|nr:hypothetical protein [Xanthobacteraceae bacterium]
MEIGPPAGTVRAAGSPNEAQMSAIPCLVYPVRFSSMLKVRYQTY